MFGTMVCATPIGFSVVLISFVALKVAIAKKFPDHQENIVVTIDALTRGIQALLGFTVIYFVIFIFDLTQDFVHLLVLLSNLFIFNLVCIYTIESRPQLKSFVKNKFYSFPYIPKPNTVDVQFSEI